MTWVEDTKVFMAPEVVDNSYSSGSDVFSVALVYASTVDPARFTRSFESRQCILPEVNSPVGFGPLGKMLHDSDEARKESPCILLGIDGKIEQPMRKLLDTMLHYHPMDRPSMREVSEKMQDIYSGQRAIYLHRAATARMLRPGCCSWVE